MPRSASRGLRLVLVNGRLAPELSQLDTGPAGVSVMSLRDALAAESIPYDVNPGDGAFYGPKIDFCVLDAMRREWQLSTAQLDFSMPERFELTYIDGSGQPARPVMIHRAILGSLERFIGILVEHYAGAFPFWLSPVQARVVPVGEAHREAAGALRERLAGEGFRVDVDERDETLGKRIREAELEKIPFVVVYGDRESEGGLAVRARGGGQSTLSLDQLLARFRELAAETDPSS